MNNLEKIKILNRQQHLPPEEFYIKYIEIIPIYGRILKELKAVKTLELEKIVILCLYKML